MPGCAALEAPEKQLIPRATLNPFVLGKFTFVGKQKLLGRR